MTSLPSIFSFLLFLSFSTIHAQKTATPFHFQFEGKTLNGLIEQSNDQSTKATVLLIPGYGRTNFVEGNWFSRLRGQLVAAGLTVVFWDKMGCGGSEGTFDPQQPVENSADEAVAAIQALKELQLAGTETIGCWGISRAGWIVPLIHERYPIDFWMSVSGTDDKENFGYLLTSNLLIAGKTEAEADRLHQAWKDGHRLYCTSPDYKAYLKAIRPLTQDSTCRRLFGYQRSLPIVTRKAKKEYNAQQAVYTSRGYFDEKSGLWVYIDDFEELLARMNVPVLALFGANDSQVDWRKTKALYGSTIGKNEQAELTTKVFEQCNHSLQSCITCAYQEDLSTLNWKACDGYYETMKAWLRANGFVE